MTQQFITLQNGTEMPLLGLGVYKITDQAEMNTAVAAALEQGYRSFDTAQMYRNETILGHALANCGAGRETLFLTSKVDNVNQGYYSTLRSFELSLKRLQTDYLDLFLIHWPGQKKTRCLDTWRAMTELLKQRRVRAIGVCNCLPCHLEWLLESGSVPMVNQIERNLQNQQAQVASFCHGHGIALEAWAPLRRGQLGHPLLTQLAEKYQKTPAQIALRWNVQQQVAVIPKSIHPQRIAENAAIFDFCLTEREIEALGALEQGLHTSHDPAVFDF